MDEVKENEGKAERKWLVKTMEELNSFYCCVYCIVFVSFITCVFVFSIIIIPRLHFHVIHPHLII